MKKYSRIIWDFNGTLVDDVKAGIDCVNIMLRRRRLKTIESLEYYYSVFCFPIKNYYSNLGFDFTKEDYELSAQEWYREYYFQCRFAPLCKGVPEALKHFRDEGIPQTVLSMSEIKLMLFQLDLAGIRGYFDDITGMDNCLAFSKLDLAKEWKRRMSPGSALFIGDTVHDLETASVLGADCVLIAGGHQSKAALLSCGAQVIDSAEELVKYF